MPDIQLFKYFESIDDPHHATIAPVMSRIDMMQVQDSFSSWMKGCSKLTQSNTVAIDGKRLKGCLVTIDAMGCQKSIAEKIVSKEADYQKNREEFRCCVVSNKSVTYQK